MATYEAYGPRGDTSRHLPLAELEAALRALPSPARDHGTLQLIVARSSDGERLTPERVLLTPEGGVPGDRWQRYSSDIPGIQLTAIRRDVAELLANGQPLTHSGDNLVVDLDISRSNLPAGSRLRIGKAVVEVSTVPHTGCAKFKNRFGDGALRLVSDRALDDLNLRGAYWTAVEAGEIAVGDAIDVLSRGPA